MKFSILVPCYNLEPWIQTCLDSVLAQSFTDWECVVVDDESHDGSPAILDAYAAKDKRFVVIHQKNAGEGGARNAGLAIAKGEWVFFLDGDDVMAPKALETLNQIIEQYPTENLILFSFTDFKDGTGLPQIVANPKTDLCKVDISQQISYNDYFVYVWQFLFRRSMIADMKFDRYKRGADRTFIVPVLCFKANSFVRTDAVCYFYRQRQGSAVHSRASVQVLKDELSHRLDVIEAIDKCGKQMPYKRTEWLEGYCLRSYLELVEQSGEYSQEEQEQLLDWFYCELPRICHAKGYSLTGKCQARLYRMLQSKIGRHFVCRHFQSICHKVYLWTHQAALARSIKRSISHVKN